MLEEIYCVLCQETKTSTYYGYNTLDCGHQHCVQCLRRYYNLYTQNPICNPLRCCSPTNRIPLPYLRRKLHPFSSYQAAEYRSKLAEHDARVKIYCSYRECSAFIPESLRQSRLNESKVQTAKCRKCNRITCLVCHEPSHPNLPCLDKAAAQKYHGEVDQEKFDRLATKKGWKPCPNCKSWTEKTEGCNQMTCPCGAHWCYRCGHTRSGGLFENHQCQM
ncbi:hypothetical protein QBC38DRAFT_468680 [Podospora fimiseda]|uniref:RBR-type E3 ubiquitin transferase n=1 Tax=Podospora fimiseda TaxID=252190 RepID=A0AAN7H765_9PEZI|nr:hypothetical protein QBC38DRAFT_468680 [Podospora fimiseda]